MKKIVRSLFRGVAIALLLTCQVALLTLIPAIGSPQPALAAQDYDQSQQSQTYSSSKKQKDYSQGQSSSDYGKAKQQTATQKEQYAQQDQSSTQEKQYAQQEQSSQSQ